MKIAIQLFGHIRTYKECVENLKKYLSPKHDYDFFMHTWSKNEAETSSWHNEHIENIFDINSLENELIELYDLKSLQIEEQIYQNLGKVQTNEKFIDLFGIKCMFESMKKANDLRIKHEEKNNINYDYVICIRPDILLKDLFEIDDYLNLFTPTDLEKAFFTNMNKNSYTPIYNNNKTMLGVDLFFFAKPNIITKILNSYEDIILEYKNKVKEFSASYLFLNKIEDLGYKIYVTKYSLPDNFCIKRNQIENDKISIIIPMYNTEKYIKQCLNSILNNTYENFEVILIDDCSNDNTFEIAQTFTRDPRFVLYRHNKNKGQAIARNLGLNKASGKYVFFLDSDDILHKNILKNLVKKLKDTNADLVITKTKVFTNCKHLTRRVQEVQKYLDFEAFDTYKINKYNFLQAIEEIPCISPGKLFNREFLKNNKLKYVNKKAKYEDDGFHLKVLSCYPQISSLNDISFFYRIRENSTTTIYEKSIHKKNKLKFLKIVLKDAFKYIKKNSRENKELISNVKKSNLYKGYFKQIKIFGFKIRTIHA